MESKVALVEYEHNQVIYTNSGLLFKNKFVLITSSVLALYIKQPTVEESLKRLVPGRLVFDVFPSESSPRLTVITKASPLEAKLSFYKAKVLAGFISHNIYGSSQRYLKNWSIDFKESKYGLNEFLSLFFVLELVDTESKVGLEEALTELLKSSSKDLRIGCEIFIRSVPFGNRAFLDSYSYGILSNAFGEKTCLLLTDGPTTPGSEGSPIFLKTSEGDCVGIVVSCLNWWKGEWVGLTLVANLEVLLLEMLNRKLIRYFDVTSNVLGGQSVVQVVCSPGWGSGILVDKAKGVFLTNSHVIETDAKITVHCCDTIIDAFLVFKTPNSDVYDLALIKCNPTKLQNLPIVNVNIALDVAKVGEEIYGAGYALFEKELNPKLCITRGHISHVHESMLKTSATILAGASGGAILRPNGELLGVIVSNTKMDDGVVYPRVNMAIPIRDVYEIISEFLINNNYQVLKKLHCKNKSIYNLWKLVPGKL